MTDIKQVYKCNMCGNVVEVVHAGVGQLVCCGENMQLLEEKSDDEGQEKHVPVLEKTESGIKVTVGSIPHPMEEAHFIEWIEVISGDNSQRAFLKAGDAPEAEFAINAENIKVRAYCNVHGLWKA